MIRLLILDDHSVVRSGYRRLFDAEPDMKVAAEAATADEAYSRLQAAQIDVAIVDLSLRGASGIEAIRRMLARQESLRILVISLYQNAGYVAQALRAGALGYLTKHSEPAEMVEAVRSVARGKHVFSSDVASIVAGMAAGSDRLLTRLTSREFEVFRLMVDGQSPAVIAGEMHLSQKTVLNYLSMIRQKLDADNDFTLFRIAVREGLVSMRTELAESDVPGNADGCA